GRDVTISGTILVPGGVCSELQVSIKCIATQYGGVATIDPQGNWVITLSTLCFCDENIQIRVACASPNCYASATLPLVCPPSCCPEIAQTSVVVGQCDAGSRQVCFTTTVDVP